MTIEQHIDADDIEAQQPPLKKAKAATEPTLSVIPDAATHPEKCFADGLLDAQNVASLAAKYKESKPYLHTCIGQQVQPELLRAVRSEILSQLCFTEKETDIYKVHQTGDLANISGLEVHEQNKLRNLHTLRDAMYSAPFRHFVSAVTGCGPLSAKKQDMSINNYKLGCHLLNHDDVIGTRRVSYILYIPDPDSEWKPEYGGALELYPCVAKGTPDTDPTVVIPPAFNQMVFFTVQPGYSFHSVQEVVVDRDRLSISGWFHVPVEGEQGYDEAQQMIKAEAEAPASLAQLEDDTQDVDFPFAPVSYDTAVVQENSDLTSEDLTFLRKYINPHYLDKPETFETINEKFCNDSSIQLVEFLQQDFASALAKLLIVADKRDNLADGAGVALKHGAGVRAGWKCQGSPVKHRFMVLAGDTTLDETETPQLRELEKLFASESFAKWTYNISGVLARALRGRARRFRPGLDYTLATSAPNDAILDATLSLTASAANPDSPWSDGVIGGYECYVAPDEGNDDPAVYRTVSSDDAGALLTVPAGWNVLTLVLRDAGVMRFVKYVSGCAPGSRFDVSFEYLGVPAEDDQNQDQA